MWFKNLQLYRLPAPWDITQAMLSEQLSRGVFHPCGNLEAVSRGWTPPRREAAMDELVHVAGNQYLLTLTIESRLLPATVINQETRTRAEKIAAEQGYPPGRKALRDLKAQIRDELMPRAFVCRRKTLVWIDREHGWLGIDATSLAKAEEVLEHLRQCLDELPLALVQTQKSPGSAMADWLASGEAPAGFTVDRDCELKAVDEARATVRYVRHPLADEAAAEIRAHLAAGKLPTRLALTWDDRISFVLTEKSEIKRLEFLDVLKESVEQGIDNAEEIFDAEFALMTGEFTRFIPSLFEALGGLTASNR
ncbi:MAG: recombination-associated protein RdgC [Zoogloeaceae bacterium]|jgi:recombination associated protein RdgC|nr:recombination-associated protein RdgC [Zoogloeaceae bacterium]